MAKVGQDEVSSILGHPPGVPLDISLSNLSGPAGSAKDELDCFISQPEIM